MAPAAIETGLPLRVMVVDDHEVVRDGIKALLNEADGILVVGMTTPCWPPSWPALPGMSSSRSWAATW
jgi:hypothetical protein